MSAQEVIFYVFASLMFFCSVMVVTCRNPISSAVYLIGALFLVAAMYAQLGADFVAAIQILVYAGAIMVLFLFVIMLLNLDPEQLEGPKLNIGDIVVLLVSMVGVGIMTFLARSSNHLNAIADVSASVADVSKEKVGNIKAIGLALFQDYVWPFEIASVLILLAMVASIVIAKKGKPDVSK